MNPIKTEGEYEEASERADQIFNAPKGTSEYAELQELLKALNNYEADFIKFLREST